MGLSGFIGANVADELQELIQQRLIEAREEERRANTQFERGFRQQEVERQGEQFKATLGQRQAEATSDADERAAQRRERSNRAGMEDMLVQRQIMDAGENAKALDEMSADLPPTTRTLIGLRRRGVSGVSAADLETPEARAERERAEEDRDVRRAGRIAGAQTAARQTGEPDAPALSDSALDMAALNYAKTGQLPPLGMGARAAGTRTQILERAATLFPGVDVSAETGNTRADRATQTLLQRQLDGITAFEKTALKNWDVFEQAARKVVDTGSPLLNRPLRELSGRAMGAAEQAAFNAARLVVVPEFARIIQNPNLTGVLTDSARHEIEAIMRGDASMAQILSVGAVLKQDAQNRRDALVQQLDEVRGRQRRSPGVTPSAGAGDAPAAAPSGGATLRYNPATGKLEPIRE